MRPKAGDSVPTRPPIGGDTAAELESDRGSAAEAAARLRAILRECGSMLIAYSGGVDSVYLALEATRTLGPERVLAVTGVSDALAAEQRDTARAVAERFGIPWREIRTRELEDRRYAVNPPDRCYFCKSELYALLGPLAWELGLATVADGANADDARDHRPGRRAARERSVRSPLQEAGLTKADIRALSRAAGLPTWDTPASPCLASRLPYGVTVTPERLRQVEEAEAALRTLMAGVSAAGASKPGAPATSGGPRENLRVRHHAGDARIEIDPDRIATWADQRLRHAAAGALRGLGFRRVLLDLDGFRSGSLNRDLVKLTRTETDAHRGARPDQGPLDSGTEGADLMPGGARGEIAVIRVPPARVPALLAPDARARTTAAARERGFRYAALEL